MNPNTITLTLFGVGLGVIVAVALKNNRSEELKRSLDNIAGNINCNAFKTSEAQCVCLGAKAGYIGTWQLK